MHPAGDLQLIGHPCYIHGSVFRGASRSLRRVSLMRRTDARSHFPSQFVRCTACFVRWRCEFRSHAMMSSNHISGGLQARVRSMRTSQAGMFLQIQFDPATLYLQLTTPTPTITITSSFCHVFHARPVGQASPGKLICHD